MGFSLRSFLGGAAGAGSRGLEERRVNLQREKETAETRQWQIATEARADSRARKAARAAKKRDTEGLLESLSFHFGDDNATKFVGKGIGFAKEALKQADLYVKAGVDPATQVKIGQITGEDLPDVTSASAANAPQGLSTGSITFKPIPPKVKAEKNSWEDKLSSHYEAKISIPLNDTDALTEWDRQKTILKQGHAEWKAAATKDSGGDPSGQLGVDQARGNTMLNNISKNVYKEFDRLQTDTTTLVETIMRGNAVEELEINEIIVNRQEQEFINNPIEEFVPDKFMQQKILGAKKAYEERANAYVRQVSRNNSPVEGARFIIPTNGQDLPTREEIEANDAAGKYKVGDVIKHLDNNGVEQYGIVGTRGIF